MFWIQNEIRSVSQRLGCECRQRVTFEVAGGEERSRERGESTEHSLLLDDGGLRILLQDRPT